MWSAERRFPVQDELKLNLSRAYDAAPRGGDSRFDELLKALDRLDQAPQRRS